MRLVLAFRIFVGRDDIPLRTLVQPSALGLVLVAGHGVGTVLGDVALGRGLLRLGTVAATFFLPQRRRFHVLRKVCQRRF